MDCGNDEVEAFDNLDTSDVVFSSRFQRIKYKIIRKYNNYPKQHTVARKIFWKVLISLMVVMSIGFMTIMAVEPLREALFKAVITQYDDHFTISFKPDGEVLVTTQEETSKMEETTIEESSENAPGYVVDDTTESDSTNEYITTGESTTAEVTTAPMKPNYIIKEVIKPTWIPEGLEEEEVMNTKTYVAFDYYLGDEFCFTYIQTPIANEDIHVDNENATIIDVTINGNSGICVTYTSEGITNLFWNDSQYAYEILSYSLDIEDIIMIAKSIK